MYLLYKNVKSVQDQCYCSIDPFHFSFSLSFFRPFFLFHFRLRRGWRRKDPRKRMQQGPKELMVLQMLDGVGSCVQTDAKTPNKVRTCSVLWEGYYP